MEWDLRFLGKKHFLSEILFMDVLWLQLWFSGNSWLSSVLVKSVQNVPAKCSGVGVQALSLTLHGPALWAHTKCSSSLWSRVTLLSKEHPPSQGSVWDLSWYHRLSNGHQRSDLSDNSQFFLNLSFSGVLKPTFIVFQIILYTAVPFSCVSFYPLTWQEGVWESFIWHRVLLSIELSNPERQ